MRIIRPRAQKISRYATLHRFGYICPDCEVPIIRDRETDHFLCIKCGFKENREEYRQTLIRNIAMLKARQQAKDKEEKRLSAGREIAVRFGKELASVYYIEFNGLIKIGTSYDPRVRLMELPWKKLLLLEPGSYETESKRHKQFRESNEFGEWFRKSDDLLEFIERRRGELVEFNKKKFGLELPASRGVEIPGIYEVGANMMDELSEKIPADFFDHGESNYYNFDRLDEVF